MADERFDLVVIGAGPAGYTASVRAAELGMTVACVERVPRLGGVCLRVGCMPSKALLESSEYYALARRQLADHGVHTDGLSLDLPALLARKQRVVEKLTDDVRALLARHKIEVVRGTARLTGAGSVEVAGAKVLLIGMKLPPNYGPQFARRFEDAYPNVARRLRVPLVPFLLEGVAGRPELNQEDGLHPNAAGQKQLAANVLPQLRELLGASPP